MPDSRRAPGRTPRLLAWMAAAAAMVAVASWSKSHFTSRKAPVAEVKAPASGAARLTVITHGAEVDGRPATIGEPLGSGAVVRAHEGPACLKLDQGVRACLLPGAVVKVIDLGEHRKLEVSVGKLVADLEKQVPGTSFSVMTRDGSVTAVGTSFSVEVPSDGAPVVARVLDGAVLVNGPRGEQHALSAHAQVTMGSPPMPLAREEETREWSAVRDAMVLAGGTHVQRHEAEIHAAEEAASDPAPSSIAVRPIHPSLPPAPRPVETAAPSPVAPPVSEEAASDLLLRARTARGQGDLAESTRLYRELVSRHPSSAEAHAAQVSLGDVLLKSGDAAGALASFDAYMRSGGALAQEASFGRLLALRALGREQDEIGATRAFIDAYPQAPQVPGLRSRLQQAGEAH